MILHSCYIFVITKVQANSNYCLISNFITFPSVSFIRWQDSEPCVCSWQLSSRRPGEMAQGDRVVPYLAGADEFFYGRLRAAFGGALRAFSR